MVGITRTSSAAKRTITTRKINEIKKITTPTTTKIKSKNRGKENNKTDDIQENK